MSQDPLALWQHLNERQQQYLLAIYQVDQENEAFEHTAYVRGYGSQPASVWRWMLYGLIGGADSPLRHKLHVLKLVDPGTGSTFEALEQRGYIQVRYEPSDVPNDPFIYVQITKKGRRLVRAGTAEQRPRRQPPGTLGEWSWRALARAYAAVEEGGLQGYLGDYGHIWWSTWLRLRDYKQGALAETYDQRRLVKVWIRTGKQSPDDRVEQEQWTNEHWLRLTAFGIEYYEREWARYRELYPDVDAPAPAGKKYKRDEE